MADFTATIPGRPSDAPGDAFPGANPHDWDKYVRRKADEGGAHPGTFGLIDPKIETSMVTLIVSGSEPSAWEAAGKTNTVILGIKADYTTYRRRYGRLVFQNFLRVVFTAKIHPHFMPPTTANDFQVREVWFTPIGQSWQRANQIESRTKLSSWGAGISISVSGGISLGVKLDVGADLDFGHDGEDYTPPSSHPTPRKSGVKDDDTNNDASLEEHALKSVRPAWDMPLAGMVTARDHDPLSASEIEAAGKIPAGALADLNVDVFAEAIAGGNYPGLVRFLIAKGSADRPGPELQIDGKPWVIGPGQANEPGSVDRRF